MTTLSPGEPLKVTGCFLMASKPAAPVLVICYRGAVLACRGVPQRMGYRGAGSESQPGCPCIPIPASRVPSWEATCKGGRGLLMWSEIKSETEQMQA